MICIALRGGESRVRQQCWEDDFNARVGARRLFLLGEPWYDNRMLSWRAKKQLSIVTGIAAVFVALIAFSVYRALPTSSCLDNKRNQGEVETDCGGPCAACELKNPKPLTVFWARAMPARAGVFDVAAEVENVNEELSSARVDYEFVLFDDIGRIAQRQGHTFLFAQERIVMVEPAVEVPRNPVRIEFRIIDVAWQLRKEPPPSLVVERREYRVAEEQGKTQSVLEATIRNGSSLDFREVEVGAVLRDREGNVVGVNRVLMEEVRSGARNEVRFIWPGELPSSVASIEVNPRANIFDPSIVVKPQ